MAWLFLRRHSLPGPAAEMPVQRRFSDLLKTPELRRLYLAVGLISSAWDVHQFVVPIYGRSIGLSGTQVGMVLAAFGLANLIGFRLNLFTVERMLHRVSKRFGKTVRARIVDDGRLAIDVDTEFSHLVAERLWLPRCDAAPSSGGSRDFH